MSRVTRALRFLILSLVGAGFVILTTNCKSEGDLGGSIEALYDLDFDVTRAYWVGKELIIVYENDFSPSISYTTFGSTISNQVVRLSFDTNKQALEENEGIPFIANVTGGIALSVERYVMEELEGVRLRQGEQFPNLLKATVHFKELSTEFGERIRGEFEMTFVEDSFLWGKFNTAVSEL